MEKRSATRGREARLHPFDRAIVYRLLRLVNLIAKQFFAHYGRKYG